VVRLIGCQRFREMYPTFQRRPSKPSPLLHV
jgi:hypothetical protein